MSAVRVLLLFAAAGLAAAPMDAQVRERAPERTRERVLMPSDVDRYFYSFNSNRGKMGITVSIRPEASDSIGALVDAVSPGSPAFKAGILSGDIITRFNGRSPTAMARESRKASPGLALLEVAAGLDAGDTARLEYRRGKSRYNVALVLEPASQFTFRQRVPLGEDVLEPFMHEWPGEVARSEMVLTGPGSEAMFLPYRSIAPVELAPVNAGLGQYFGVSSGVLVVSVPEGSSLGLRSGDVVLAIDGRKVTSPSHVFRILRSYDEGESFRMEIMRMKRREAVTGKLN